MRKALLIGAFCASLARSQGAYLTYGTGTNPAGVVAADLNGDGRLDLAIVNAASNSLTILLNTGNGTFNSPAAMVLTGSAAKVGPRNLVAVDLNRDGKIDLVLVGYSGLAVLLGNGDGSFQPAQLVATSAADLAVGDLNGDGIPDLAVTALVGGSFIPTGAALSIYLGNGDGTFSQGASVSLGFTPWAVPAIGDFNGDGKPDIAVAVGQSLIVFQNDGKANLQAHTAAAPWNFAPAILTGDFNGDGVLDLAVSGQVPNPTVPGQGILTTLLGKGDGTFQALSPVTTPTVGETAAVADLNHDGHLDLVLGLNPPAYFAGRGDGTFAAYLQFGASGSSGYLAIGDFTGSGTMGLAATNGGGSVVILPRAVWPSLALSNVSAAGYGLGPLSPGSIVSAFGVQLATQTATASGTLPTLLGGDSVTVTGSDGKANAAALYYVSSGQVNYVIPAGVASGLATVSINSNNKVVATGPIDVEPVAPSLFTLNASNLAAANVVRVSQNGQQTYQPVYRIDLNGNIVALPIDLSSSTDAVYLAIYGTGMRNVLTPIAAIAVVGGSVNAQVTYVGPQGGYEGLDQINILLPKSTGPGPATVQITVGGQPSNTVNVAIQ